MKNLFLLTCIFAILVSCNTKQEEIVITKQEKSSEYLAMSVLWYQCAAEQKAAYYQAYNYAKIALDNQIEQNKNSEKPNAVVFDIDETLVDNSPFNAKLVINNSSYTKEEWKKWSDLEQATALPGAKDFVEYAISKDVEIIFISNRLTDEIDATKNNLDSLGFPNIPKENYFLKTTTSSKIDRRAIVSEKYNIILLIGDNLNDFSGDFENRANNYGFSIVEDYKDSFGDKFILLPNPMYGSWEKGIEINKDNLQETYNKHFKVY